MGYAKGLTHTSDKATSSALELTHHKISSEIIWSHSKSNTSSTNHMIYIDILVTSTKENLGKRSWASTFSNLQHLIPPKHGPHPSAPRHPTPLCCPSSWSRWASNVRKPRTSCWSIRSNRWRMHLRSLLSGMPWRTNRSLKNFLLGTRWNSFNAVKG